VDPFEPTAVDKEETDNCKNEKFVEKVDIVESNLCVREDVFDAWMVDRLVKFRPIPVERVDIVERRLCVREDVFDAWMVDRLVKFRPMPVERVDIVERRFCVSEDVFDPRLVERVEIASCVSIVVDTRPWSRVEVFEPCMVDRVVKVRPMPVDKVDIVDSSLCVREDVFEPWIVESVETAIFKLDILDPDTVETSSIWEFIYGNIPLFAESRALLMITNLLPMAVEKLETEVNKPVELRLEKTDPHMTEILDAFVEIPLLNSKKLGPYPVDRFEIEEDKVPKEVDKFHEDCVDKLLYTVESPVARIRVTVLRPVVRPVMDPPIPVDTFEIWVDVFKEMFEAVEESPSFSKVSAEST
jgi:hypothetical protein